MLYPSDDGRTYFIAQGAKYAVGFDVIAVPSWRITGKIECSGKATKPPLKCARGRPLIGFINDELRQLPFVCMEPAKMLKHLDIRHLPTFVPRPDNCLRSIEELLIYDRLKYPVSAYVHRRSIPHSPMVKLTGGAVPDVVADIGLILQYPANRHGAP